MNRFVGTQDQILPEPFSEYETRIYLPSATRHVLNPIQEQVSKNNAKFRIIEVIHKTWGTDRHAKGSTYD